MQDDVYAFDYDYHYDKQKAADAKKEELREAAKQSTTAAKPQSRYLGQLQRANERREVEKAAAWERMEAKNNKKDGGQQDESFVTSSYLKQLEIQKEGQLITAVEEELNKKKTATAERGMTGFYTNYISKIRGVAADAVQDDGLDELDEVVKQ